MTAEQLEEILGKVTQGEWVAERDDRDGVIEKYGIYSDDMPVVSHFTAIESEPDAMLIAIAPSLARRVIAAENLVEANSGMEEAIRSFLAELRQNCPLVPKEIHEAIQSSHAALTAYREASK